MSTEPTPDERYAALQTALARYEAQGSPQGPWTSLSIDAQNELIQAVLAESKTNGAVIDRALAAGPLGAEELTRRAQIGFFNHLAQVYDENAGMAANDMLHPESRQVSARVAELAMAVARSLNPDGFVAATITREELDRLRDVLDEAYADGENIHLDRGPAGEFAETAQAKQISAAQADVERWIAAASA